MKRTLPAALCAALCLAACGGNDNPNPDTGDMAGAAQPDMTTNTNNGPKIISLGTNVNQLTSQKLTDLGDGRYRILDGLHRAAILAARGATTVACGERRAWVGDGPTPLARGQGLTAVALVDMAALRLAFPRMPGWPAAAYAGFFDFIRFPEQAARWGPV